MKFIKNFVESIKGVLPSKIDTNSPENEEHSGDNVEGGEVQQSTFQRLAINSFRFSVKIPQKISNICSWSCIIDNAAND